MSKLFSNLSGIAVIVLLVVVGGTLIALADSPVELDPGAGSAVGTAFTYQGQLTDGLQPADGRYDFSFVLYDDPESGSQIGPTLAEVITATNGLIAVELDFGSVFDGSAMWLQIGVRPDGETDPYTLLLPRQKLTAAPFAAYAGTAPWSGLADIPAGFADGIDNDTLYEAGTGLGLVDSAFAITPAYQLPQGCDTDQFVRWTGTGWACTEPGSGIVGWSLSGNSDTTPGVDFLGTTDDAALQLHVNGERAFRLEPDTMSPNILGGYRGNYLDAPVYGATIGGGGWDSAPNRVSASFGTVDGGAGNSALGYASAIGGGEGNSAGGNYAVIGGGATNNAVGDRSTIGGGSSNAANGDYTTVAGGSGNSADAGVATIAGGGGNTVSGTYGAVGGGLQNQASGYAAAIGGGESNATGADYAAIGGGYYNAISAAYGTIAGGGPEDPDNSTTSNNRVYDQYGAIGGGGGNVAGDDDADFTNQEYATVSGGRLNTASGEYATAGGGNENTSDGHASTVGGGAYNSAGNNYATVGGGTGNSASGQYTTVAGGQSNSASGSRSAIGGGQNNSVTGAYGTIPGGALNSVDGNYGFAAGLQAHADHNGVFVWSDSTGGLTSTGPNQFLIDASGGVGIGTDSPTEMLTVQGGATIRSSDIVSVSVIYADAKILQQPRALYAVGDLLYATGFATNTLSIWNVTDPPNHSLIGYTTFQIDGPMDVQVVGDRAYIASQESDMLTILDVSDPADISHVGDTTEFLDYPQGVHVSGKYAYVASWGYAGNYDGLTIYDVTDAPAELAATSFITTNLDGTSDVFVVDNYAYVTSENNNRLVVFDVSDARNPQPMGYVEGGLSQPVRVHVSGVYAYVLSEGTDAVVVYDVSDPSELVYLDEITTGLTRPRSIYVSDDRAYVAYAGDMYTYQHCGLAVLDLSDPAEIGILTVIDMSEWLGSALVPPGPMGVTGSGDRIYVANEGHDSVSIFEIDSLQASAVRAGEMQVAHLEVADYAAIEGDLGVRGGLNVGSGGALVQGTLSVEGPGDSYIQGRLGIGPVATVITRTVGPGEWEEIVLRQPTHQLDVDGEGRFRVNDHTNLLLRSPNTGSDEDAFIDLIRSDQTTVVTPSARIEFDVADPVTHTTSMRFYTQAEDDTQMQPRLEITSSGDVRPGADDAYTLGTSEHRWQTVYSVNGFESLSDARSKENVESLPHGLESVMALRPVIFGWLGKPEDGLHYGLIAQEVRDVLPEVVSGDDGQDGTLGLNYGELVPVLVKAVQDQQTEIDAQAEQIAALEARLDALEQGGATGSAQPRWLNLLAAFGIGGLALGAVTVVGIRRMGGRP